MAVGPASTLVQVGGLSAFALVGSVSAFSIGSNGALTPVPGSPFATGFQPLSVTVDPTGKFAYVANELDNNVSAYSIGSNGALTTLPASPFATRRGAPVSVAQTPPSSATLPA